MLQQLLHNGPAAAVENLFCSSILLLLLLLLLFDTGNIISDKSNLSDIKTYIYISVSYTHISIVELFRAYLRFLL